MNKLNWIFILLTPIVVYLLSASFVVFNLDAHEFIQDRNEVKFDNQEELNRNVIDFFHGGDLSDEFTQVEKDHMIDVRNLINYLIVFFVICLIVWLVLLFTGYGDVMGGGLFSLLFPLLFLLPFDLLFFFFHFIFFESGSWIFEEGALLIQLYPYGFFRDFALLILGIGGFLSILILSSKKVVKILKKFP